MTEHNLKGVEARPAGYEALIARYDLDVFPNWHRSFVSTSSLHRIDTSPGVTEEIYSSSYWPGDTFGDHLEFALKYDGTNLPILASLFERAPQKELLAYIESKPNGKYVDLLDPKRYFTVS